MFVDLLPTQVSQNGGWISPSYILLEDGNFTYTNTSSAQLFVFGFESLPTDIVVTGLQILIKGKTNSSSSTAYINAAISLDNNFIPVSSLVTPSLTTTNSYYTIGSSSSLSPWNYDFQYWELNNQYFSITLNSTGDPTVTYLVDDVKVRVYYTQPGYLVGNRSHFSHRNNSPLDNYPSISNGLGIAYQVKSEQLNALGDSLYNIEQDLIWRQSHPQLTVIGGSISSLPQYFFTLSLTGAITSSLSGAIFEQVVHYYPPALDSINTNLSDLYMTSLPGVNSGMRCSMISGIGWVETASGNVGVFVSPSSFVVAHNTNIYNRDDPSQIDFWISLSAYAESPITVQSGPDSYTVPLSGPSFGTQQVTYKAVSLEMNPLPIGTLYIKLFAVGVPGVV